LGGSGHYWLVTGPFQPSVPARYSATNWLTETIQASAAAAKTDPDPLSMLISVGALSASYGDNPLGVINGQIPYPAAPDGQTTLKIVHDGAVQSFTFTGQEST